MFQKAFIIKKDHQKGQIHLQQQVVVIAGIALSCVVTAATAVGTLAVIGNLRQVPAIARCCIVTGAAAVAAFEVPREDRFSKPKLGFETIEVLVWVGWSGKSCSRRRLQDQKRAYYCHCWL